MSPLLERIPLGYDLSTLERLRDLAALLPELPARIGEQSQMLGITGSALVLLLLGAIGYALFGQRRFAERCESALDPLATRLPEPARPWLSALAQVLAAGLVPLGLWALHVLTALFTEYRHPAFVLVGSLLLVWMQFAVAVTIARELLVRPLLRVSAVHGRYLYNIARWILAYGILLSALLGAVATLGAPPDVVALLRALFRLSLIAFLAVALSRKSSVMALFPELPNRPYRAFVGVLERAYPLVLILTVATALLSVAGYVPLARFLWVRIWALAGLFLTAVLVIHFLHGLLRRWILTEPVAEKAWDFYRSAGRLLDYVGGVVVTMLALRLTGLRDPVVGLLGAKMYSVDEREVSILLFVVAAAIIIGFILLARLLRDYLDFRVYPALRVEEGVAHAISTFVFYMLTIIGVLIAIEAIGLGLSSLTIFAGALGVGVGFGLQTLASNLASGLTLIFSRALRRGDWVTVGDTIGVIQEVGMRATSLRTRDAVEYLVPNSEFISGTIVNWTHTSPYVRLHVPLGVSYGSDPDKVKEILLTVAADTPNVQKSPAPDVWFVGFGDSSIDFELLVWGNLKQVSEKQVRSDLYFRIFKAFRDSGIEIPFPQRDLHVRTVAKGILPPGGGPDED